MNHQQLFNLNGMCAGIHQLRGCSVDLICSRDGLSSRTQNKSGKRSFIVTTNPFKKLDTGSSKPQQRRNNVGVPDGRKVNTLKLQIKVLNTFEPFRMAFTLQSISTGANMTLPVLSDLFTCSLRDIQNDKNNNALITEDLCSLSARLLSSNPSCRTYSDNRADSLHPSTHVTWFQLPEIAERKTHQQKYPYAGNRNADKSQQPVCRIPFMSPFQKKLPESNLVGLPVLISIVHGMAA
jgi:hypothetical protein